MNNRQFRVSGLSMVILVVIILLFLQWIAGMDMENTAHNQPVITGLAPEAMLSRQNLARSAPARECRQRGFGRGR